MESYGRFAGVYDVFMDNVNYREWADYIIETLAQDGIRDGLVLELGCGTGTVTEMLADAGYDMIGIDNSEEMLAEAMEKRAESGHDILYLLQDMQEFRYDGNVGELINIIQYMCGSALLNSEGGDIHITRECYPDYLFAQIKNREISEAMEEIRISPGGDTRRLIHQTNPVRLRGQRETGGFLLNLLCKDESPDVP